MSTSISTAITLMVVGMITVFLVLFLVYITGNILIRAINRWIPDTSIPVPVNSGSPSSEIPSKTIAAITTAVEIVSDGKAQIINIEKQ
jgi:oxaloacetate decarboxylase gamma subunit